MLTADRVEWLEDPISPSLVSEVRYNNHRWLGNSLNENMPLIWRDGIGWGDSEATLRGQYNRAKFHPEGIQHRWIITAFGTRASELLPTTGSLTAENPCESTPPCLRAHSS